MELYILKRIYKNTNFVLIIYFILHNGNGFTSFSVQWFIVKLKVFKNRKLSSSHHNPVWHCIKSKSKAAISHLSLFTQQTQAVVFVRSVCDGRDIV